MDGATCKTCTAGRTNFGKGKRVECDSCVHGTYQNENDVPHVQCKNCVIGTSYVSKEVACDACVEGKYQEVINAVAPSCKTCGLEL